ncbi:MAG: exodeoxyribonuclease VII small subunit [Firmicutes bacterium]|nr:exodeoxyribonuclease VII small subunit [Bacillota bacterium]
MTYEQNVKRIEEIVEKLEDGKIGLDEAAKLFEEGVQLSKSCFNTLKEHQGKISVLQQELGKFVEKPM